MMNEYMYTRLAPLIRRRVMVTLVCECRYISPKNKINKPLAVMCTVASAKFRFLDL